MKTNGQITAALLAATLAAAGCSTGDEKTAEDLQPAVRMTPVSMPGDLSTRMPANYKGIDEETPIVTGPADFADGETAYSAGKYSEAAGIFEQYTIEKPDNAWGHFMLGLSAWKAGDPGKSEAAFGEALRIDPDHMKSLVNLSRVLIEQKRFDEAIETLNRAGEIDPDSAEVHRLLGRTYSAQGKVDESVEAYRQAIALDEKDAWSMNNLGFVYIQQGRSHEAVLPLARAVELRKDVAIFHNNLGMALEHTGRFTAAAGAYNDALEADPGYAKAEQNLARVEAVKVNGEEPFDLEATAKRFVEQTQGPVNETASAE